jgi:hypothetical protein
MANGDCRVKNKTKASIAVKTKRKDKQQIGTQRPQGKTI